MRWYRVEGIVDPAQGFALDFGKALNEEAGDTRHLLRQLNTVVDEAAVTRHLLDQPNNVHDDQTAVISHLLDSNTRTLDYMITKANQTGYSVVPPPAQAKADHGVLGIMSSSCPKECKLN